MYVCSAAYFEAFVIGTTQESVQHFISCNVEVDTKAQHGGQTRHSDSQILLMAMLIEL